MNTLLLPASDESVARAAQLIKDGQLVGFPTETVYGLGADALNARAVLEIFAAKGRPADNPLFVHIARWEEMEPLCHINDMARKLAEAFWPGPLTMILPKKELVPAAVTAGLDSVAIRMPSHPVAHALIEKSGCPIAAPSGNRSGRPSPTLAAHMMEDMDGRIPLILDGGPRDVGVESTVVALTGDIATVLRPGGVTPEMIAAVLGEVQVADSVMRPLKEGEAAPSPGMKHKHYAPKARMTLYEGEAEAVAQRKGTDPGRQRPPAPVRPPELRRSGPGRMGGRPQYLCPAASGGHRRRDPGIQRKLAGKRRRPGCHEPYGPGGGVRYRKALRQMGQHRQQTQARRAQEADAGHVDGVDADARPGDQGASDQRPQGADRPGKPPMEAAAHPCMDANNG